VNIPYRLARAEGRLVRSLYIRNIEKIVCQPISQTKRIEVSVFSFSCETLLSEQTASIRSFIRNVGVPDKFVVVSDGTYSESSASSLKQIHSCVDVVDWACVAAKVPDAVTAFAKCNPMGKKLATLISLPVDRPTIYTDCDMLFFPHSGDLIRLVESEDGNNWYLPDCLTSLDDAFLHDESEKLNPVNAGFMVLKKRLDWSEPLERLSSYSKPGWATEQTIVHLAMHQNNAQPLSPDKFILNVDDQFIYRDLYAGKDIALRHYVNNVRHKFWQSIRTEDFSQLIEIFRALVFRHRPNDVR
jgi:hypothetical protein